MKYLLPCSCGKSIRIEISQAGQTARCSCGNTLDVPALRLIRQLPVADAAAPARSRRVRSWSVLQGIFFAVGLILVSVGLARAAYFQWGRTTLNTEEQPWDDLTKAYKAVDAWDLNQTWDVWKEIRGDAIGPYNPPVFIAHRFVSAFWLKNVVSGLALAGVGFLLLLSAFIAGFVTRPSARRTTRPATSKR